ncbi:hypothetical protein VTK73DRAFT_7321 [Phialemonium thermophilum]|uniref:Histidine acid phosphatase family protein n=1 Tax=Phialemonium thermophilum TaxID=223376 RepID=A0ABR3XU16_9PEZI
MPSILGGSFLLALFATSTAVDVDLSWYPPSQTQINNLTDVLTASGVYGFIYDTSDTPDSRYGVYNWCNMPHVRKTEYKKPSGEYELKYVELIHRHHKRTPYSSNAFPIEPYQWNCDDQGLFYFGRPFGDGAPDAAESYWAVNVSPINPFVPSGWIGTCQFPQITGTGLEDSWQHGQDLYGVYHDLLHFLPDRSGDWPSKVKYRVTNNVITSQVAGMVINGMWGATDSVPLLIESSSVDSLEPTYGCSVSSSLFGGITSGNNPAWAAHLQAAQSLYATLDAISGVSPSDSGFHASFDHYYDNLSARQCHQKPLPCKLVNGVNSSTCITQDLADEVYRFGNWEYSQMYRDASSSLPASAASFGVWVAELAAHIRDVLAGNGTTLYFHNIAHDGSVSRLLSVLQIDTMVWPGMGSEVVFELWKKKSSTGSTTTTPAVVAPTCNHDNCLRQMIRQSASASIFCPSFTATNASHAPSAVPTWLSNCNGNVGAVSSACECLVTPTPTSTSSEVEPTQIGASGYYIRVLFGGQVLKSSNPSLGVLDLIPVETLLAYFDGLVGVGASLVKGKCNGSIRV